MNYYYYTLEYKGIQFKVPATNDNEAKRFAMDFAIPKANASVDDILIIDRKRDIACKC